MSTSASPIATTAATAATAAVFAYLAWRLRQLPTLDEIGLRYMGTSQFQGGKEKYQGGDKTSAGQGLTATYEELIAPFRRARGVQLLEIGVFYGKSLALWCDALPRDATVHGVDINLARWRVHSAELRALGAFRRGNVQVYEQDTSSDAFAAFAASLPPLDVVIDDGNHTANSQWRLLCTLFTRVRPGGVYVIEDIEQPSQLFSPTRLAALVAGLAHPSAYWHGSAVQAARDDAVAREEQRLKEARANEASAVATLRDKCAQMRTELPGREGAERALREREARLAAMPLALDKPAKAAVKRDFDAALAEAKAVSELAVAVSVHKNMVVLTRRGTRDSGTSVCY